MYCVCLWVHVYIVNLYMCVCVCVCLSACVCVMSEWCVCGGCCTYSYRTKELQVPIHSKQQKTWCRVASTQLQADTFLTLKMKSYTGASQSSADLQLQCPPATATLLTLTGILHCQSENDLPRLIITKSQSH